MSASNHPAGSQSRRLLAAVVATQPTGEVTVAKRRPNLIRHLIFIGAVTTTAPANATASRLSPVRVDSLCCEGPCEHPNRGQTLLLCRYQK
jgi:hypothetical protein